MCAILLFQRLNEVSCRLLAQPSPLRMVTSSKSSVLPTGFCATHDENLNLLEALASDVGANTSLDSRRCDKEVHEAVPIGVGYRDTECPGCPIPISAQTWVKVYHRYSDTEYWEPADMRGGCSNCELRHRQSRSVFTSHFTEFDPNRSRLLWSTRPRQRITFSCHGAVCRRPRLCR